MMTQLIVRAMSMVRDAMREAVAASLEFQVRIAELQTVSARFGKDFATSIATSRESLVREVAEFATAFNIPLPKVAEGLYQTISDQFVEVTDRTNVMRAAAALAKVGVMEFDTAISLITGTLNAYGMSSSQASSLSMKFFETIRLGHVRGDELAQSMGQMIPIAAELGVTIDELNASVVAMTIGGMSMPKSATAIRGAMMAFMKPSEEMQRLVHEMGFADPSQLIAAKRFQGAMQAIADASANMGSKISQSVRNMRALTAELRLTSPEGALKYKEALDAMAAATPENLQKILEEFRSTSAESFTKQINALSVNLTRDLGPALVSVLDNLIKVAGGADTITAALLAMIPVAVAAAAAILAIAAAVIVLQGAATTGPAGLVVMMIALSTALAMGAESCTSYETA